MLSDSCGETRMIPLHQEIDLLLASWIEHHEGPEMFVSKVFPECFKLLAILNAKVTNRKPEESR